MAMFNAIWSSSSTKGREDDGPRGDDEPTPTAEKLFDKGASCFCLVLIRVKFLKE